MGNFFWEVLKNTTLSAYKDKINDYETKKNKEILYKIFVVDYHLILY